MPQQLPLSPWQCEGVFINISEALRSSRNGCCRGKHLDQQITGSPVQALHTRELRTCVGKRLGKSTGVPSRWEAHRQTNQLQSDMQHEERGKNQCKEGDFQTQSPGTQFHGAVSHSLFPAFVLSSHRAELSALHITSC